MNVHNHDIDPSCREVRSANGALRGECMNLAQHVRSGLVHQSKGGIAVTMQEQEGHDRVWVAISLHDRVHESLAAKIEGNGRELPIRGMFNCADVQALLVEVLELRTALARHQSAALMRLGEPS